MNNNPLIEVLEDATKDPVNGFSFFGIYKIITILHSLIQYEEIKQYIPFLHANGSFRPTG